jgi:hypothetical protein
MFAAKPQRHYCGKNTQELQSPPSPSSYGDKNKTAPGIGADGLLAKMSGDAIVGFLNPKSFWWRGFCLGTAELAVLAR